MTSFALVALFLCSPTIAGHYSTSDLALVRSLNEFIQAKFILFLSNYEHVDFVSKLKSFSSVRLPFAVTTSRRLDRELDDHRFFRHKTLLVSKQTFNLSAVVAKSPRPGIISCIIFQDYDIYREDFIPMSIDVFFVDTESHPKNVTIHQIYKIKRNSDAVVKTTHHWHPFQDKLLDFQLDYKKNNFHNTTMIMHILLDKEFCQNLQGKDIITKVECLHQDMIRLIGRRLNFGVNEVECIEKENPYTFPNGSESELFIKLRRREVDFSVASHLVLETRFKSFDFVWPTFVLKTMMYIKQSSVSAHWASYLRPLNPSLWWGVLWMILAVGLLLQIFKTLLRHRLRRESSLVFDYLHSTLTVLQIFCNQGVSEIPSSHSIRFVYLLTFIVVLVIFQAYTGYLVSSLTIVDPYFPFTDLKGFFQNKNYKIMTIFRGFHKFFYSRIIGRDENLNFLVQDGLPNTPQEAIDKLCELDNLVFSEFREELLDLKIFKCNILELPHHVARIYMTMVLPKNSPFTELVNRERIYLDSTGLTHRMRTHLSARSHLHDKQFDDEYLSVSLEEVFSIFILLGGGILLSLFFFIAEIFVNLRSIRIHRHLYWFNLGVIYLTILPFCLI